MTTEEAINLLDPICQKEALKKRGGGWLGVSAINKALEMAVTALRAQQAPAKLDRSRWEECPRCTFGTEGLLQREVKYGWKRGESVISGADEMYIIRYGDKDYSLICECTEGNEHETEIKYCPFCGRPLTEAAWAELERRISP